MRAANSYKLTNAVRRGFVQSINTYLKNQRKTNQSTTSAPRSLPFQRPLNEAELCSVCERPHARVNDRKTS